MSDFQKGVATIFTFIIMIPVAIFEGWVLCYLWKWFFVPFGIIEISIPHAIGMVMAIGYFTGKSSSSDDDDIADSFIKVVAAVPACLLLLLFGWIIKSFM